MLLLAVITRVGVKDAGKAEADGVVGGSENCGDVGDGVDELFEVGFV